MEEKIDVRLSPYTPPASAEMGGYLQAKRRLDKARVSTVINRSR